MFNGPARNSSRRVDSLAFAPLSGSRSVCAYQLFAYCGQLWWQHGKTVGIVSPTLEVAHALRILADVLAGKARKLGDASQRDVGRVKLDENASDERL